MGKKKHTKPWNQANPPKPSTPVTNLPSMEEVQANTPELVMEAEIALGSEAFSEISAPPTSALTPPNVVRATYSEAFRAKQAFEEAKKRLKEAEEGADAKSRQLQEQAEAANRENERLLAWDKDLLAREEKVALQEADALQGFQRLGELEKAKRQEEREKEEEDLSARKNEVEQAERELKKSRNRLKAEAELLSDDRAGFDERVEQKVAALAAREREENLYLRERLSATLEASQRLRTENAELHAARPADLDASMLQSELNNLRTAYSDFEGRFANHPSAAEIDRLRADSGELDGLREQLGRTLREKSELAIQVARATQGVGELEALRDMKESAEAQLKVAREELRSLTAQFTEKSAEGRTFPALSKIDKEAVYQSAQQGNRWSLTVGLAAFVADLQQSMKADGFEYSLPDLRCFVAGMAMSRLHILQGISGTGKTSLPVQFAKSTGVGISVVAVQAGWRDRQDLLGYYNAFEKSYRQTEFLHALYLAQTPLHRDLPYLIVLDEMNLSRPEQYFADLLSAMERKASERELVLMDRPVDDAPALFVGKQRLRVPENVWFVGTANHDETTVEFADKTYDRAHIMELPRTRDPIKAAGIGAKGRLHYKDFHDACEAARQAYEPQVTVARDFLAKFVAPILDAEFDIGLSNRLMQRQLGEFVPVYNAAGGETGEAVDHILATRLLRKASGQHDTTAEQFRQLAAKIKEGWSSSRLGRKPEKSLRILEKEIRLKEPAGSAIDW